MQARNWYGIIWRTWTNEILRHHEFHGEDHVFRERGVQGRVLSVIYAKCVKHDSDVKYDSQSRKLSIKDLASSFRNGSFVLLTFSSLRVFHSLGIGKRHIRLFH